MPRGIAASVAASVLFGAVFFVAPLLRPLSAEAVWGARVVVAVPFLIALLAVSRQLSAFGAIAQRIKARPVFVLGVLASGLLLAPQLWLFAWAPMNGRGLQTALGYFLLPLVLVVQGRVLYKDKLAWWHWLAVGIAAVGVGFQIVHVGEISWETLLVALGYPLYFGVRRALGLATTGGLLWELVVVLPVALFLLGRELPGAVTARPNLLWLIAGFGLLSAIALWLYVLASKLLPISLFGLLSYVEPALLVVVAFLLGERIDPAEYLTYAAIWLAVLVLLVGGIIRLRDERGKRETPLPAS